MTLTLAAVLVAACMPAAIAAPASEARRLTLHYDKPATSWNEALPVGNGRLGAMVFGRPGDELLQLNEATLWSGGPVAANLNPAAFDALAQTRAALDKGDYAAGAALARKMQGPYSESYEPLGDLLLHQDLKGNTASRSEEHTSERV